MVQQLFYLLNLILTGLTARIHYYVKFVPSTELYFQNLSLFTNMTGDEKGTSSKSEDRRRTTIPQYIAAIVVNFAAMSHGYALGWPSPMLPLLQSESSPLIDGPLSNNEAGWIASLLPLGACTASPIFSYFATYHSRKLCGYVLSITPIICWLLIIFTRSYTILFFARFFVGFLGGGNFTLTPLYVTEISEDKVRGSLGSLLVFSIFSGVVISYAVGSYTSYTVTSIVGLLLVLTFLGCFFWMPESPIYLVETGQLDKARESLVWLRNGDHPSIDEEISKLSRVIQERVGSSSRKLKSIKNIFATRANRKAFLICTVLVLNSSLSGFFAVMTFTVTIFRDSGSNLSPNISTIIVGFLQVCGVGVSIALLDRAGRRIICMCTNVILTILLTLLGIYFHIKSQQVDVSQYGWVPLASLCGYVLTVGSGPSALLPIMMSELFPPDIKFYGITYVSTLTWLSQFTIVRIFLPLSELIGIQGCFWVFASSCLICSIYFYFFLPETKNRSLESVHEEMNGKVKDIVVQEGVTNPTFRKIEEF